MNLIVLLFFCLFFFQKFYHYIQVSIMKIEQKSYLKKYFRVSISWNLPFFFAFLVNSSSISLHNAIKWRTSWSIEIFPAFLIFSPFSSSSFMVTIVAFFFVVFFLGRGVDLRIFYKFKFFSTCENECFNPAQPKFFVLTFKTPSYWTFPRIGNAFLQATTLCGSVKTTMPTLDVFENGMVGVHSTNILLHPWNVFNFCTISTSRTSENKTLKNNENNEKQWKS